MKKHRKSLHRARCTKRNFLAARVESLEQRRMLADFEWSNPAGGTWNTFSDWLADGIPATSLPGVNDNVTFDKSATYVVTNSGTPNVANMTAAQGTPTLALANSGVNIGNKLLVGGGAAPVDYTIDGPVGIYVKKQIDVGAASADGTPQATFSLTNGADLSTGILVSPTNIGTADGPGQMAIKSGSTAQIYLHVGEQDVGELTVDGTGSSLKGSLAIGGDGTVLVDNNASLASHDVSVGTKIGSHGQTAKLTLSNGAVGSTRFLTVGHLSTGTLTIDTGASYTLSRLAVVGFHGPGTLEMSNGASATFEEGLNVADFRDATVNIDDSKVVVPVGQPFTVGIAAVASFTLTNGATLTTDGGQVGATQNAAGTIMTIDGTVWDAGRRQNVFEGKGSIILFKNGGSIDGRVVPVQVPPANIPPAQLVGIGTVNGDVEDPGVVEPGLDPTTGTLTVTGAYLQDSTASLAIGIASATSYDVLADGGTATLDGTLAVSTIGAPDFEPGQRYNILTAGGVVGNFANFVPTGTDGGIRYIDVPGGGYLPLLPSGLEWEVEYTSSGVTLVVVPSVSIKSDGDVYETDQSPGKFTVTRTGPTTNNLTVTYETGGTASHTDYNGADGTVTIPIGARSAPIEITPIDDGDVDDNETSPTLTLTVKRQTGVYIVGSPSSDTMTLNEEKPPTVTIVGSGAAVEKGPSGQFTVSRTGPIDSSLTVGLASGGTAQAGVDYQSLPSSVTIPAGSRTAPVVVNALDDGTSGDLSSENVTETIQPSSAYNIGSPSSASVPIEEEGFTTVTIAATTASTTEGSIAPGVFTVTRAAPYTQALTVSYSLSGSATNGVDYQSLSGTVTIPAGAPTAPIYVAPLDDGDGDDSLTSEAVVATLQPGTGYQVGTPASDTVTINEEAKTTVTIAATANAVETSGTAGSFTVTRTGPTTAALNVTFSLGGSAVAGVDYSSPGTSVTIPAGQASATITIAPIDDGQTETSKTVTATLVDEPGIYAVGTPSAAQIGIDEDGTETVNLSATVPSTNETGNMPGVITVTRTGPITNSLTVNYQTQGTAQSGVDYQFLSGSVTIPAGQVSADIDIVPLDDESQSDESQGDVAGASRFSRDAIGRFENLAELFRGQTAHHAQEL